MIEVKNLNFKYKDAEVLSNINVSFEKGKFYGIIGPNGSGKSTLLKLISNKLRPQSGEILIDNKKTYDYKGKMLSRKLSVMPQSRHKPDMTVFDFVACGRFPYKNFGSRLNKNDINIINNALRYTKTENFQNRNLKSLSGGECQRVFFAQLLAQDTKYLLCDEPTTFLDLSAEKDILEFLKVQSETKCVVAVLHNVPMALKYCDCIAVLEEGKMINFATPKEVVESKTIDRVFNTTCHTVFIDNVENYLCD